MSAADASASGSNGGEPFVCLAEALLGETRVSRSDRPGRASLRVEGRVFATDLEGWLVLRLPAARADALVASGLAQRLDPGHDSLLREWVAVAPGAKERWIALAREAGDFVRARGRVPQAIWDPRTRGWHRPCGDRGGPGREPARHARRVGLGVMGSSRRCQPQRQNYQHPWRGRTHPGRVPQAIWDLA
jgi:hypothetical protein